MNKPLLSGGDTIIVVSAAVFLVAGGIMLYSHLAKDTTYTQNANYALMTDIYTLYPTASAEIVMLGDSHTFGINWSELFANPRIINRGIRGDILPGMSHRLDAVIALRPHTVCIMGGINDIYANYTVADILDEYTQVVEELRAKKIRVVIQSTLCIAPSYSAMNRTPASVNAMVQEINTGLEQLARTSGATYLNINAGLCSGGALNKEFTVDGIHLNAAGYAKWKTLLAGVLEK
ncbi:MAG: hypothetical protein JNL32_12280 [Candidatus Kapabacteria bacterium]|nr:hypothetical protein [Candidatus Kapabacteria bacterium]